MQYSPRYFAIVSAAALALACADATAPSGGSTSLTSQPTTPVSLAISPDRLVMRLGDGGSLAAVKVMSDGTRIPVNASWVSFNYEIVTINAANGYAVAVGPGQATIRAQADGLTATISVVVLGPTSTGASEALVVQDFSMIEFQYPSEPGRWFYAPQLRVLAAPGRTVSILRLTFSIPGLADPIPSFGCGATLSAGAPRELNGEFYGDWTMSIDGPGRQASGEDATAVISFLDDAGTIATRTVRGPVVRGSLPATYSGGQNAGACFHGYGSGG